ncbi:glycoprotein vOX2-2A [Elephant endotheliotropic herpesvirus 5B]|nr:glycoprotein vOX2-2A [Elephant endotheliotropic herpesvirus 5B]UVZ35214.1 glycoprotein vOX2-2A [Elephant endotheliotropic herpesvirus 5B]
MALNVFCFFITLLYSGCNGYIEVGNVSSLLGSEATLTCSLQDPEHHPIAMRWQKDNASIDYRDLVIFFSGNPNSRRIYEKYQDKINVSSNTNLRFSSVTFMNTSVEDAGCFLCVIYCSGESPYILINKTCLTVHDPPTVSISVEKSENKTNVTCTATSLPASVVQWIGGDGIMNSTHTKTNENGTVSFSSTLYFETPDAIGTMPYSCNIEYSGNVTSLTWNPSVTPTPRLEAVPRDSRDVTSRSVIFGLSLTAVTIIVIISLIIYYYYTKKHEQNQQFEAEPPGYKKLPEK